MLNRQVNHRQTGESAAPQQQFNTPQDEIRRIRATDRTLAGFVRVLEIVRGIRSFEVDQAEGQLPADWLNEHSVHCAGCVGALASWFFGGPVQSHDAHDGRRARQGYYNYKHGQTQLARYLGLGVHALRQAVRESLEAVSAGRRAADIDEMRTIIIIDEMRTIRDGPFCGIEWPADHAEVFRHLAERFPGK